MKVNKSVLALSVIGFLLLTSGCAIQRAQIASAAKQQMIGMNSEQILACMGIPAAKAKEGNTEVWNYYSGGEVNSFASSNAQATAYGSQGYAQAYGSSHSNGISFIKSCNINLVFQNERVAAVNYTGRTGGLITEGEQCAFAVKNCVKEEPS